MSEQKEEKKPSIVERVVRWVTVAICFVTYDIWRITDSDVSGPRRVYIYVAKTLILAIRGYQRNDLQTRASALTYSTLLSVVPMLAVVVGIASGFGVKDMIEESLYDSFPSQSAQIARRPRAAALHRLQPHLHRGAHLQQHLAGGKRSHVAA